MNDSGLVDHLKAFKNLLCNLLDKIFRQRMVFIDELKKRHSVNKLEDYIDDIAFFEPVDEFYDVRPFDEAVDVDFFLDDGVIVEIDPDEIDLLMPGLPF